MPTKLTNEIINAAIVGYEVQKTRLDAKIAELRAMLSGGPAESAATSEAPTGKRKRRKMSAEGRRAIAEAQRKRWAAAKKATEPAPATSKPKRKLSKAGRAAIVAATKARWDRVRAEAAKAEKAESKKTAARKTAAKAAPVKAVKKSAPVKKAAKTTVPAPTPASTESGAQ